LRICLKSWRGLLFSPQASKCRDRQPNGQTGRETETDLKFITRWIIVQVGEERKGKERKGGMGMADRQDPGTGRGEIVLYRWVGVRNGMADTQIWEQMARSIRPSSCPWRSLPSSPSSHAVTYIGYLIT
jgi:hypothetical protein